ncbi:MAG: hypothetical protein HZB38_17670 [Planctomycetes bacterium]|nr:hypothetical protein [Planctomycetota bacterium]
MNRFFVTNCAIVVAGALVGCGENVFPDAFDTSLTRVDGIRNNANLTGQEKRDQLAQLGLDEVTINGLMRSDRTANQFGGTANTAFDKVVAGYLDSLTPDEVQLYGDLTSEASFTDAQAQELVDLFKTNGILTAEQLGTWLDENDIDSRNNLDEGDVRTVFVTTDPNDLIESLP